MAGIYRPQCGDYSLIVMLHHLTPEPADDFCSTLQCCMPGPSVTKCSLWPLYGHPTPWHLALCLRWADDHDQWLVRPPQLWPSHSQDAVRWQQQKMLQNLTSTRKQQAVCGHKIHEARCWCDPWFPGWLWPLISIGPDSQNQSVIPAWVSLCTGVHQVYRWYLLAPGTNIAHHLASLETFTCFEMCYSRNNPHDWSWHWTRPSCSLEKFPCFTIHIL